MKNERTNSIIGNEPATSDMQTCGIVRILQMIRDMEERGESEKKISGSIIGPFFSRAEYEFVVRTGIGGVETYRFPHRKRI